MQREMRKVLFTFHYVSIKTFVQYNHLWIYSHLHSTMYLLKPLVVKGVLLFLTNLHSTMYLLKRAAAGDSLNGFIDLHSTMYLLKLGVLANLKKLIGIYIPLCIY